jgi:nucleoside-diphosphate-sugar epimerase
MIEIYCEDFLFGIVFIPCSIANSVDPEKVYDESDWNTTSTLTQGPYRLSKYLAEKAAWDWWQVCQSAIEDVGLE